MKKYLPIILLFIIINGCEIDDFKYEKPNIGKELTIDSIVGIKLETPFVEDIIKMNLKTKTSDKYYIYIVDITDKVISKSEVTVRQGDNILNLYSRALPVASYRIKVENKNGELIAVTDFNKIK